MYELEKNRNVENDEENVVYGFSVETKRVKGCTVMNNRFFIRKESILSFLNRVFDDGFFGDINIEPCSVPESAWKKLEEKEWRMTK